MLNIFRTAEQQIPLQSKTSQITMKQWKHKARRIHASLSMAEAKYTDVNKHQAESPNKPSDYQ